MRIVLDGATLTGRFTGDRTYWLNLISNLPSAMPSTEFIVVTPSALPEDCLPYHPNLKFKVYPTANSRAWTMRTLPHAAFEQGGDILHTQYTTPLTASCKVVTSVHDISFRLHPEWFPLKHRLLMNLTVPLSMRQAQRVLTLSQSSKADIVRTYNLPNDKVEVVPLGVSQLYHSCYSDTTVDAARQFITDTFQIDRPFLLAVGVMQPRKNLALLTRAFGMAITRYQLPHKLVFTGKDGWGCGRKELEDAITQTAGAEAVDRLHFTGYVEDEDLPKLYRASTAFAYPSLYEGFGLPPLEAMACGTPVLASNAPAMPEVVGDAALLADPVSIEEWSDAIARALTDEALQADLIAKGLERVKLFRWERTAAITASIYESVLKG